MGMCGWHSKMTWNASYTKVPLPRISVVHQLKSLGTLLGLLCKSMCILLLLCPSSTIDGFHLALRCARLKDQTGLWLHNFLRSILNIVRSLENIRRFSTCWTSFDILAFHNFGESFVTATALEILRQIFSQYLQVLITFRTFVHMNQSLCTSWCFIKSIKMQITWSWMKTETRRES